MMTRNILNIFLCSDDIEKHMKSIENDLIDLEDYCDRCEITNNKLDHQYQLSLYKQRKNVQLEEVKSKFIL